MKTVAMSSRLCRALETCIDSRDAIELLLALHRSPSGSLAMTDLAAAVQLPRELVRRRVASLSRARFVELTDDNYVRIGRFAHVVDELAIIYEHSPDVVLALLSELAVQRLRRLSASR